MARKSKGKKVKKITMIFCEGETEKYYFDMLKRKYSSGNVIPIKSEVVTGNSWVLVQNAITKMQAEKHRYDFEQVYVVYDKDNENHSDIEKALKIAKDNKIITLYSNQCFEYWVHLHYKELSSSNNNEELYRKLQKEMGLDCSYSDIKGEAVATYLVDKVHIAFENAIKLNISNDVNANISKNPYTNIHHYIKDIFNTDKL
ncbi:RloB family protein [Enterococcus avium]|uniref:RloB family protein n=1 Tax=Enterococcus avium TaxID=33945 RepID=UPI00288D7DF0|nr:RloB family protein [Enterococcus avium]MDT2485472.1 RloB family protein [Enterococcus avium]MDT2512137.1 RloB family protein [Enterococcus avium]